MTQQRLTLTAATLAALALTAAGTPAAATPAIARRAATATRAIAPPDAPLEAGVRAALAGDYRVAVYVLWHNSVPATATEWVSGPALAALRTTAAARQTGGIRIKALHLRTRVVSLALSPARNQAIAIVTAHEVVQPSNPRGVALGRTITLNERARFVLHRVGVTRRFVVWQVAALR
jgi:hypothetical protein